MPLLTDYAVPFLTLATIEIVLGIDNIVFIAILTSRLPEAQRKSARIAGLAAAMIMRILLLLAIKWIMGLTAVLFTIADHGVSGKDLILILGGLFLVGKATHEIHNKLESHEGDAAAAARGVSYWGVIFQIMLIDIVFSLDSVITAVGMAREISVMIAAVVASVIVMMLFAGPISNFIERNPTFKILALAFLVLIGVVLIAEGLHQHISKGYVYFAMAFSVVVELINIRVRKRYQPIQINQPHLPEGETVTQ